METFITIIASGLLFPILLELWKEYRKKQQEKISKKFIAEPAQDEELTSNMASPILEGARNNLNIASSEQLMLDASKEKLIPFLPSIVSDIILMSAGIALASFALKSFLLPNSFLIFGLTGISLIVHDIFHINIVILIPMLNLPFIIIGWKYVNRRFGLKTLIAILTFAVFVMLVDVPPITMDKLLVAIFGGFLFGCGVGLCIRAGCTIESFEVVQVLQWKLINTVINSVLLISFLLFTFYVGIETALYATISYIIYELTVDRIISKNKLNKRQKLLPWYNKR